MPYRVDDYQIAMEHAPEIARRIGVIFGLYVLIEVFGPVSGAHFNPAVSLVLALRGQLAWTLFAPYVLAQLAGALMGAWLANAMFDVGVLQVSTKLRSGTGLWIAETVATAGLTTKTDIELKDADRAKKGLSPARTEVTAIRSRWAAFNSCGSATSYSLATRASFLCSARSAAFQSCWRSRAQAASAAVADGRTISACSTPRLRV